MGQLYGYCFKNYVYPDNILMNQQVWDDILKTNTTVTVNQGKSTADPNEKEIAKDGNDLPMAVLSPSEQGKSQLSQKDTTNGVPNSQNECLGDEDSITVKNAQFNRTGFSLSERVRDGNTWICITFI